MYFVDLKLKKISGMLAMLGLLALFVIATAATWAREIGTFSIPAVEQTLVDGALTWEDRIQFNWRFGVQAPPGASSLLAMIGVTPPAAAPGVITPSSTTAQAIPVLLYHGITQVSTSPDETTIDNFKAQMFALKAAGWQTVSIEDFVAAMQGRITLPPRSFLLTFDDGRQDAYVNATPILQAVGYQAVMYVIAGHSLAAGNEKSKYYVTEDQLQDMLSSGVWELQSHSDIGHAQYPVNASGKLGDFFGNRLWIPKQNPGESSSSYAARVYTDLSEYFRTGTPWDLSNGRLETQAEYEARIQADLENAKELLGSKLNVDAISFAYPYNDFASDLALDEQNGVPALVNFTNQVYDVSFYQWYASLGFSENYPGADGQLLKRIEPQPSWTPQYLLALLESGQPKSLPYSVSASGGDGWQDAWGTVKQNGGTITLDASTTTAGASTILDGTRLWSDYDSEIQFDWRDADSVSLFARYVSSPLQTSYLACNFSNGSVRLEAHVNGSTSVIAQKADPSITPGDGKNAGIRPVGNQVDCLANGAVVVSGRAPSGIAPTGGIGLEIWNPENGTAGITVTNVTVEPYAK